MKEQTFRASRAGLQQHKEFQYHWVCRQKQLPTSKYPGICHRLLALDCSFSFCKQILKTEREFKVLTFRRCEVPKQRVLKLWSSWGVLAVLPSMAVLHKQVWCNPLGNTNSLWKHSMVWGHGEGSIPSGAAPGPCHGSEGIRLRLLSRRPWQQWEDPVLQLPLKKADLYSLPF